MSQEGEIWQGGFRWRGGEGRGERIKKNSICLEQSSSERWERKMTLGEHH